MKKAISIGQLPTRFWFMRDDYRERIRVGQSNWFNDQFEMLTEAEFEEFKKWCIRFTIPLDEIDPFSDE